MITVQPIRFTSRPAEWHRLAVALGLVATVSPSPEWSEFDGNGSLAIHSTAPGGPDDGRTQLTLLCDDLDGVAARLDAAGIRADRATMPDIGPMATVHSASGASMTITAAARPAHSGALAVLPIWYQADLAEPRTILAAVGMRPRIASDSGDWTDYTADGGGLAAVHAGAAPSFELAFELDGDLEVLARRLDDAGFATALIDESYARTLRVGSPDGDQLWVNEVQRDLYGYTRVAG